MALDADTKGHLLDKAIEIAKEAARGGAEHAANGTTLAGIIQATYEKMVQIAERDLND